MRWVAFFVAVALLLVGLAEVSGTRAWLVAALVFGWGGLAQFVLVAIERMPGQDRTSRVH